MTDMMLALGSRGGRGEHRMEDAVMCIEVLSTCRGLQVP